MTSARTTFVPVLAHPHLTRCRECRALVLRCWCRPSAAKPEHKATCDEQAHALWHMGQGWTVPDDAREIL